MNEVDDPRARRAWEAYEAAGKEILNTWPRKVNLQERLAG